MKFFAMSKRCITVLIAAALVTTADGCGQSSSKSETNNSTSSQNSVAESSIEKDEKNNDTSSETSVEESTKEESSKEARFDVEKEMQIDVLAVHKVPYDENRFKGDESNDIICRTQSKPVTKKSTALMMKT